MGRGKVKEGKPPAHRGVCPRRGAGAQTRPLPGCVVSGRHLISLSPAPGLEVGVGGPPWSLLTTEVLSPAVPGTA